MQKAPRRRRDSREPGEGRTHLIAHPSERDIEIFKLLDPVWGFKYLTSAWINHFAPTAPIYNSQRLGWLQEKPNCFLRRPPEQANSPNSNYKHMVYERDERAENELGKRGIAIDRIAHRSNSYPHELLVDLGFYAPMRYAVAQDASLRFISPQELLSDPAVPERTRKSADPFRIPLSKDETRRFDGVPFALERTLPSGKKAIIFVPGIEADRKTEGLRVRDFSRSAFGKHIRQLKEFFDRRLYQTHYGFPNSIVPIIFTNAVHMQNAMEYVREHIGPCRYLLFKHVPDLAFEPHFPPPSGEYFTTPWKRVGHPDFSFDEKGFS